jgi:PAS domain S-box-containing protein
VSAVIAELSSGQTTEADQTAFSILDAVSALVLVIDPKGFIVRANDAAVRVTGYQPSDVKGRPVWDFLSDPIERRYVRATFSFLRPERFPNQFEYTLVTKEGQLKPIAWSNDLILNQAGEMSYMIATGIDLSDVRRVGQELVRSEAQNRALLDAIPDVMMRMDRTGVFLSCSISGESALFFPNGSFIGRNLKEVLPGDLALEVSNAVLRAFDSGELQVFEYNLKLDGQTRYYEARLTTSGENEVLSIIRDVTEQKRSAERLRRRDAILEVVNFAAERFLEEQDWRGQIQEVLARLGQATDASRVYLFENHLQPGASLSNCLSYEWAAPGVESQQLNTELMAATYLDPGVSRLVEAMRRGETIAGHVKDFTPAERAILGCQNVLSLVIVPIFLRQEYWGFIGLDECRVEREWSDSEVEALEAAASLIGSAIERARMSQALMVTLQISQAAHSTQDLDQLYMLIHESVGQLMPASSFYIALYDRNSDLITFPYFIDEFEEAAPPTRPGKGLTEYVLRTGKALLASPEVFYQLEKSGEVESVGPPSIDWLGAPLQSQGRTIGVLVVQSYTEGVRYRESDRDILSFVSTQVANTIERKQAEQALQRQLVELSVLHAVALAGAEAQTEDELIERATALIGRMLYTDSFGLLLLNPDGTELHFHPSYHGLPEEVKTSTVIPIGRGAAGRVAASGWPLYISDTDQDQEYIHLSGSSRSELCVPLKIGERIIGVINAERSSPQAFSPADERLLLTLASQMATAIERRRTETALRASEELYRTLVDTSPDWIIMIDLDGRVLLVNEVMIRGMGFTSLEQVRGLNAYQEFISEDQIETVKEAERQLLEGKLVAGEYMIRRRDGHSIPVELNASLILDADGSRRGFIGILRDITERKRRDHEREAIISVAGALRAAHTRAEMIPIILEHLIALLKAEASALVSGNFSEGVLSVELGSGRWEHLTGQELSSLDDVTHRVVSTGEAHYTSRDGLQSAAPPFRGFLRRPACPCWSRTSRSGCSGWAARTLSA